MLQNLRLFFHTVRHLKPIQIKYQITYRLIKPKALKAYQVPNIQKTINYLSFCTMPPSYTNYLGNNSFVFLNITHHFKKEIDWNYQQYGKLWNYNLQYANYLLQLEVPLEERQSKLRSLYEVLNNKDLDLEPYPVSLRSINCIRLFSLEHIIEQPLIESLYAELNFLSQRLEYHLLGNHLLENAFALLMGGAFFSEEKWQEKGQAILIKELEEQVLQDGAHFELSPMYHQIILFRLLELYDWYIKWENKSLEFETFIRRKSERMLAWLKNISFKDGSIPHFNDSTNGIAYATNWLLKYAEELKIVIVEIPLGASGYRSINKGDYELRIDFAQLGPSYQPGHAHADNLSFILYYKAKALFIEQGTSTYTIGARRSHERSTQAHNTVVVNGQSQSEVWSGFRVGQRAKTTIHRDDADILEASHDGYQQHATIHRRSFDTENSKLIVTDSLSKNKEGVFYLHIHPNRKLVKLETNLYCIDDTIFIDFDNAGAVSIEAYDFAESYNKYGVGQRIVVNFVGQLQTSISFN